PVPVAPQKKSVEFFKIRSPETYLGYNRTSNFVSNERIEEDKTTNYTPPSSLRLNNWALGGAWKVIDEASILQAPGGKIQFRFEAPKLNLVMKGNEKGISGKIFIDGAPVPANMRGADVGPGGRDPIKVPRLYNQATRPRADDK